MPFPIDVARPSQPQRIPSVRFARRGSAGREAATRFGFECMPPVERFEAMMGAVVPRPVAPVTSLDVRERLNAAP